METGSLPSTLRPIVEISSAEQAVYDPRRLTGVSVYREIEREFSVGDRIQFTAPDKSLGVANRDLAAIESISPDCRISARLDNNRQVEFNASEHRRFDHGYAVTSHSSQGLTAEPVLVNADTGVHPDLLNSRFGYVSISRASHEAIGEVEIERLRETHYDGSRAGKNFALGRQTEPLVLPSEVSGLDDQRGFLKYGNHVARFSFPFIALEERSPGFDERQMDDLIVPSTPLPVEPEEMQGKPQQLVETRGRGWLPKCLKGRHGNPYWTPIGRQNSLCGCCCPGATQTSFLSPDPMLVPSFDCFDCVRLLRFYIIAVEVQSHVCECQSHLLHPLGG
jgi:hypothetical protein